MFGDLVLGNSCSEFAHLQDCPEDVESCGSELPSAATGQVGICWQLRPAASQHALYHVLTALSKNRTHGPERVSDTTSYLHDPSAQIKLRDINLLEKSSSCHQDAHSATTLPAIPTVSPVLYMHGNPDSGIQITSTLETKVAKRLGVQWIGPDHPGVGLSTMYEDQHVTDYKADMRSWLEGKDLEIILQEDAVDAAVRDHRQIYAQGAAAHLRGIQVNLRPWGFRLDGIKFPGARLWYGADDVATTPIMGRYMAERLPEAVYREFLGKSDLTIWDEEGLESMLRDLLGAGE